MRDEQLLGSHRWRWRVCAATGIAAAALWFGASPAGAQVEGPCEATIAGQDVREADSPSDAIEVDYEDEVEVAATTTGAPIDTYEVELEFAGFSWPVADGDADGDSWDDVVEVSDYATFSVGLYKVHGISYAGGEEVCRGTAYIEVTGKNPLLTVAGAAAAVLVAAGVALMISAGVRP